MTFLASFVGAAPGIDLFGRVALALGLLTPIAAPLWPIPLAWKSANRTS